MNDYSKIGVCIMKDMTRWGRDYLQVGNAMENLKGVMNGKTAIPTKTWKTEYTKLTERNTLNQWYLVLKGEGKEADQIRKSVYSILRQEQREQAQHRTQDMER